MPRFVGTFMLPDAGMLGVQPQVDVFNALKEAARNDLPIDEPADVAQFAPTADYATDTYRYHVPFNAPDIDEARRRLTTAIEKYRAATDVRVELPDHHR